MSLEQVADKVIETDVLVIGGAIAGCAAAAKAAENGLKVTLAEKAKIERSGTSGQGIDHYGGAFPRGMTPKDFTEILEELGRESAFYGGVPYSNLTRIYRQYANGYWAIEELEKLGVTMRWTDGEFRPIKNFGGGSPFLRVHWVNVKPEMAAGVRKRGVNVLDRTMIVDFLTNNGAVVGATAVNSRTGEFIVIRTKAIVVATGMFARCYNPEQPCPGRYKFRYHCCPAAVSGDGGAMAYRAGAELSNMEQARRRGGTNDDLTISFGNFINEGIPAKALTWDGEEISFIGTQGAAKLDEMELKGRGPFYMSLEDVPDDFHKRIEVCYADERLLSFKIAQDRGFNPRKHWFQRVGNRCTILHAQPGISADGDFKTTLKGLYAAGDCVAGSHDVANAATAGFLVGDSIRTYVNGAAEPVIDEAQVESQKETALAPLAVKDGTDPMELEMSVRGLCDQYVCPNRGEGTLREGLRRMGSLRRVFLPQLMAKNPHYLMRALEVRNIMEMAEAHMRACLERRETRGYHFRRDYPEADPKWEGMLTYQRLENGKPVLEMRKQAPIALPDDHKEER